MVVLDLDSPPSLKGKRVLVTGGGQGLGRSLVQAFLAEGAKVAVCARHDTGFGDLRNAGAIAVTADVTDPGAMERLMEQLGAAWGELDAVVNNAAVFHESRLVEQPLSQWRETIDVDLNGPYHVIRSALGLMRGGCIVNITSGLGRFPMEPYGAYCVAKAGLNMLTRALAQELRDRCRVNAIDPGEVRTRMNPTAKDDPIGLVPVARALVGLDGRGPTGRCFRKDGSEAPWE